MSVSRKRALVFLVLAISGFAGCLYLTAFAGILLLVYRTGEIVIKADALMPAESLLLIWCSIVFAYITIWSISTIASQLKREK